MEPSELERLQVALHESEARYQRLLESVTDYVYTVRVQGGRAIETVHGPGCAAVTGYCAEDYAADPVLWYRMIHEQDKRAVLEQADRVLLGEVVLPLEHRLLHKDGTVRWVRNTPVLHYDSQGSLVAYDGLIADITERKQAEESLRTSETRLRLFFEQANDAIFLENENDEILDVNTRACQLLGYSRQELLKLHVTDLQAPEIRGRLGTVIKSELKIGQPQERLDVHRDGTRIPVEVTTTRIEGGEPGLVLCIVRDITERKRAEEARLHEMAAEARAVAAEAARLVLEKEIAERRRAEEALNRRAAQLALINDIGRQIAAALDIDEVLERAARLVQQSFGYHHVGLFILDSQRGALLMTAKAGDFAHLYPAQHRVRLGQGMVGWVGFYGQKLLANDVRAEPRYINFYPDVIQTGSELSVPIQASGKTIGVLDVQSPQLNAFDENDTLVIETLADQIAVAIDNARLYETVQRELTERRRAEKALRSRNEELVARNAIAVTLSQSFDLESLLHATLDTMLEVIDLDAGWIQLLNDDGHSLSLVAQRGFSPDLAQEVAHIQLGEGITGQVAQSGRRVVLDEAWQDPRLASEAGRRDGVHALAAVPIMAKDKVTGVLGVLSHVPHQLSSRAVELITTVGHQLGLAIENVRLARQASEIEILREVDRLRAELLANISHELKTPLGLIKVFCTSLLEEDVEFDRATQREFLSDIRQETERLEDLVNNLLDLSRIQDGQLRVDKCPTDLAQSAREIMRAMEFQSILHSFVCDFVPDPLEAIVDPKGYEQVLRNLLSNAIKYSPAGGTITVQGRAADGQVTIRVSDQGIGIPADELDKIFERFYRAENEFTSTVRGAGLGLPVCRGIVEAHGGRIWAESTPGQGSIFCMTWPASPVESDSGI